MKSFITLIILFLFTKLCYSQSEMNVYSATGRGGVATTFVTDYQVNGINPANLGWAYKYDKKKVTFGFFETSASVYCAALGRKALGQTILDFQNSDFDKKGMAEDFANKPFYVNFDALSLGLSINTKKFGGIAFSMRDRVQWGSQFNKLTSELLFQGVNASYFDTTFVLNGDTLLSAKQPMLISHILDGSKFSFSWYREYAFSYGVQILKLKNVNLYGGIGVKYLQGFAILDINVKEGEPLDAFASISPIFGVDVTDIKDVNDAGELVTVEDNYFFPKPMGTGIGFDLGVNVSIKDKLKVGAAINNIGSMTWKGNVFTVKDTVLDAIDSKSKFDGFDSYNFYGDLNELATDNGFITWKGNQEKKADLPTMIRLGASYKFGRMLELGVDVIIPTNEAPGNLDKRLLCLGGDFSPFRWVKISTGVMNGGNFSTNVPAGITFIIGKGLYETGIATRDILTYFKPNHPTLSYSYGFMRLRFGNNDVDTKKKKKVAQPTVD